MDDYTVLTGHNYMITNDILFNIGAVVGIICIVVVVVAYKSKRMEEPTKRDCGKSESEPCDNSHANNLDAANYNIENTNAASSGSIEYSR